MTEQRHGQEQVKSTREAQIQAAFPGTSGFMADLVLPVQVARLEAESRQRGAAEQAERQGIRESLAEIRRQLKAKKAHAAPVFWGGDFFLLFFLLLLFFSFWFVWVGRGVGWGVGWGRWRGRFYGVFPCSEAPNSVLERTTIPQPS